MNTKRILICSLLVATLAGCGGSTQPQSGIAALSDADIQQNENYEELLIALQDYNVQLAGKSESSNADKFARRGIIEDRLVDLTVLQLDAEYTAKREDSGVLPIPAIDATAEQLTGAEDISAEKWQRVLDRVSLEKKRTKDYVDFEAEKLSQNISDAEKLAVFDNLHRLSGDDQWVGHKDEFVDKLVSDVRDARAQGRYIAQVQEKAALIRAARPDDSNLADELASYDARAFENAFLESLGQGDLDSAYAVFTSASQADNFDKVVPKLEGTSQTMADYFLAKADAAVLDASQLKDSFRLYDQGRVMYEQFQLEPIPASRFDALVRQLTKKFQRRVKAEDYEAALGYLLMIGDIDPDNTNFVNQLNGIKARVQQASIRKITTTEFVSSSGQVDYSDVLATYIAQYLFEQIPFDVRIIERQQYEATVRERERKRQTNLPPVVDYLVTGSIIDAKVNATERRGKKIMRVTVGHETVPNPAYNSWLQLSAAERGKIAAPAQTIEREENENVSVGVTEHRKAAKFTLSYRLVDASTEKVIFPDSITKESKAEDTSTEGIEIGEFVMPFKVANLPSDSTMLDTLAKEVALDVGAKLVEQLANQEEQYLAAAEAVTGEAEGECQIQVQALARAAAMQEMKSMANDDTLVGLKEITLGCY
ncbi:hypothetical protein [Halioxenophilus aromaticivorans]|uniref:Curli production assembly/transport component CsgG n=1 Tax=Halioxenophilus aromaticivorans TaxID=1306992 RepID=A0AAV3U2I4_9ALTE